MASKKCSVGWLSRASTLALWLAPSRPIHRVTPAAREPAIPCRFQNQVAFRGARRDTTQNCTQAGFAMSTFELNRRQALIVGGLGALSLAMPGMVMGTDQLDASGKAV